MLPFLAAEWWDDHDDRRISQVGRGADSGRQKVYSCFREGSGVGK